MKMGKVGYVLSFPLFERNPDREEVRNGRIKLSSKWVKHSLVVATKRRRLCHGG